MLMDNSGRHVGSLISEDEYYTRDIQSEIEMAKKVLIKKKKSFTGKNESGSKEENNEMIGPKCNAICSRDRDVDPYRDKIKSL